MDALKEKMARACCKPKRADDGEVDEIEQNLWKTKKLISPDSPRKARWDNWILLLVAYSAISLPMMWAFRITPSVPHLAIDYVLDLFFWADIVVSLRTTWRDQDTNDFELDDRTVMRKYSLNKLVPFSDFFGAFPLEVLAVGLPGWRSTEAFAALRLPRWIFRMLAYKIKPDKNAKRANPMTNVIVIRLARVARLFTGFLFFAHWVACFWWVLGIEQKIAGSPTLYQKKYIDSWILRPGRYGLVLSQDVPLGQRYLSSFYWSLSTLMKTAWITPGTTLEKLFGCVVVFLGAIIFAFILASVSAVVNAFDDANAKRREKMSTMLRFSSTRQLSSRVSRGVLAYVDAEWSWTGGIDPPAFLKSTNIPARLCGEMLREMYKEIISVSPLFKNRIHVACVTAMLQELVPQAVTKKATLIQAGELCFETFILVKGSLNIVVNEALLGPADNASPGLTRNSSTETMDSSRESQQSKAPVRKSKSSKIKSNFKVIERQGACVGIWSPFVTPWRAPYTATAIKLAQLFGVRAEAMKRILNDFKWNDDDEKVLNSLEKEYEQVVGKNGVQSQLNQYGVKSHIIGKAAPTSDEPEPEAAPGTESLAQISQDLYSKLGDNDDLYHSISKTCENAGREASKIPVMLAAVRHLIDPSQNEKPTLGISLDDVPKLSPSGRHGQDSNRNLDSKLAHARKKAEETKSVTEKTAITDERKDKNAGNEAVIVAM